MRNKFLLTFIFGVFLISMISATTCSVSSISKTYTQGDLVSESFTCTNTLNSSITISSSGESSLISFTPTTISSNSQATITINFLSSASVGLHSASLNIDNVNIPISFLVSEPSTSTCAINVFPTTLTNIKITQGETKTRTITLSVPSCFTSAVTIQGISLQTDQKPITLGELSAGNLNPGQSINIPVELNAIGVATGQYNDVLQFLIYNSSGNTISVPNTNIGVLVSQGVTPISNFSITEIPSCSLSASELNLNSTYSFTCSISNPNIKIQPIFDSNYLVGISDVSTSSQYVYNFKAKKIGNVDFKANFFYEGSSGVSLIGDPFLQELKITNTGNSAISGTSLDLIFYQDGILKTKDQLQAKETIIQAIDNESRNLVEGYEILIGGIISNNTITLESDKIYYLTVTAPGFNDLITNISASKYAVPFEISPSKTEYVIGDTITFNSSVEGTTYLINGIILLSPYTFNSIGTFEIVARNPNYEDNSINVSVVSSIRVIAQTPIEEWRKGTKVNLELSQDVSNWEVWLNDSVIVESGTGKLVSFKTSGVGYYTLKADGVTMNLQEVMVDKYPFWKKGLIVVGGILFVIILIFLFKRKGSNSSSDVPSYGVDVSGEGH